MTRLRISKPDVRKKRLLEDKQFLDSSWDETYLQFQSDPSVENREKIVFLMAALNRIDWLLLDDGEALFGKCY